MKSAEVQQLEPLSDLFREALTRCRPASVAILGIAGGNGLEHIEGRVTRRIVGLDVNPSYLDVVRHRYPAIAGPELYCVDLAAQPVNLDPVELVHAALVFEHAGVERCLENAMALVAQGGSLSVVLQLRSESEEGVSPTAFSSMQSLKSHFSLIDPAWLEEILKQRQFRLTYDTRRSLPANKGFWMGIFRR